MKGQSVYTYDPNRAEYLIKIKSGKFPWWILLFLLLPLILLIKTGEEIEFIVKDNSTGAVIESASVDLTTTSKGNGSTQNSTNTTNGDGKVVFKVNRIRLYQKWFSDKNIVRETYTVKASKQNYNDNIKSDLTISALKNNADERVLRLEPMATPPEAPQKPKEGCRAFFTGLVVGGKFLDQHISEVYVEDEYSEYVGAGEYPDNEKAFPKSVATTFDGIAIDAGTRVIIYAEKDFKGDVLLDKTGPAIINNIIWKDDERYSHCNTEDYKESLQKTFPQSVREWSKTDMQQWSYGSLKVICK